MLKVASLLSPNVENAHLRRFISNSAAAMSHFGGGDQLTGSSPSTYQDWKPERAPHNDWKRRQRLVKKVTRVLVPERFTQYDEKFANVVTFEKQLESLKLRGFLRCYKAYTPPTDLDRRFARVCSEVLPEVNFKAADLSKIVLDRSSRGKLLLALEAEFSHAVPNSLLHTLSTLDHVFLFYSTPVDVRTPYEKLHDEKAKGNLPPNLHIQLRAKRFDPEGDHPLLDKITAYPRSSTIMVTPEARKKYKDVIAEHSPYRNSASDTY